MQILFINTNPIVQKLIEVTAAKANVRLITVREPSEIGDIAKYDYIIADDGCYSIDKSKYKQLLKNRRACLIYSKEMYSGFSEYIKKPFIPTHILNIIIEEIAKSKKEHSFESIEEEVVPEDMSVDSVLQATRAMRTAEDSLSSLDLLSKELNIKHPEASPQEKVNDSFAKQSASEPPAKEISTEELLADTDLHKDEQAPESLDIDDINLDDLVDETESTPQEEAKDTPPPATPPPEPTTKEDNEAEAEPATLAPEASDTQPQVLDKEQISEVSELLDAIGDESNGETKQEQASQPATESTPSESTEDAIPDLAEASESPSESDTAGESDLDLDALGLELADKPDESTQEAQELDLDSIDLTQEPTSSDEVESTPQEEATTQESHQEAQELEDVIQESPESPAQDEVPQESSIQDEVAHDEVDEVAQASELTAQESQDSESDSKQAQEFFADTSAELGEASQDEVSAKEEPEPATEVAEMPQDEATQAPQEAEEVALEDITESLPQEDNVQESGAETSVADELGEDIALDEVALADVEMPADEPSASTDDVADIDIAQDSQSSPQGTEDFSNLNENEVAEALGEEPLAESQTPQDSTSSDEVAQPHSQSAVSPAEIDAVKNAIGKSLEGALQSMASNELKTLLDGMEVSINISFKDAKK
ncbi:hypothetical protein [Helicobacter sp. 23-1046]